MSKKSKVKHNKGKIRDNALKASVRSNLYRPKVEKDRTKYNRKKKHKGRGIDSGLSLVA